MKRAIVAAGATAAILIGTGCAPESKAKDDLEDKYLVVHKEQTDVISSSNSFPNLTHTCWGNVGVWLTTDRMVLIIYNDPQCPEYNPNRQTFVVSNIPGNGSGKWIGVPES
jgi:hypothetical protein